MAVSEAVSTLRLRYGEGGRFRFLAGALLSPKAAPALRVAGISFLNAFLTSAPRAQTKLYIQAEACEAGLEPRTLQEWLKYAEDEEPLTELLREEVRKWSRHCVDVDALQGRARRAEETCRLLSKKVSALQRQLQKIQLERLNEYNTRGRQEAADAAASNPSGTHEHLSSRLEVDKKVSSSAEDEGISFSERSSSPDDQPSRAPILSGIENDQETTIDDVIEELRIIVKDAEEELHDWNNLQDSNPKVQKAEFGKTISMTVINSHAKNKISPPSKARECLRNSEESARIDRGLKSNDSLKIVVPGPHQTRDTSSKIKEDKESDIIPAIIHPQPPRRPPPFIVGNSLFLQQHLNPGDCDLIVDQGIDHHRVVEVCPDSEHENELLLLEDDGSDSLLSASRLNYHAMNNQAKTKGLVCNESSNRNEEPLDVFRRRQSVSGGEFKIDCLTDFEISETILDERIPKKKLENSGVNYHNSNVTNPKQYSKCNNTVQRRTERRKYLRRCQSQDHIEPRDSCSLKSRNSDRGVIEHIRKFESLNNFEERRCLPNFEVTGSRLRRSESFHQTRLSQKDCCSSSRGGSDSGLVYCALESDSNYESKQPRSMTKSLDRIDEGLDAMVGIAEARGRNAQRSRRFSNEDEAGVTTEYRHNRVKGRRHDETDRIYRFCQDKMREDMSEDRKYTSFLETRRRDKSVTGTRHQQHHQQPTDSRVFASRPHDVLGFGKNRFNAGKYSGNNHPQLQHQFIAKTGHRHSNGSSNHTLHGKVTDMVSGLY